MENLGLYLQVPLCASKCSFCNFSSQVVRPTTFEGYCQAVISEIDRIQTFYDGEGIGQRVLGLPVETLYVGGGTPSLLGAERVNKIVEALLRRFRFVAWPEFTLEVTPGSVSSGFLTSARALGINRLSVGAQSFDHRELRSVGRLHSPAETQDLVRQARSTGFLNINLDLIAGLPHQTMSSWVRTLRAAVALEPEHISVYLFEIDEKSRLGREVLRGGSRFHADAVPGDDFMADAYELAGDFLAENAYWQYEISNFALPGHESRHNRRYWQLKPYVGLGAGAHSFDGERRWANETDPELYQQQLDRDDSPIGEIHALSPAEQVEEFFFLGLRERRGVDLALARKRWGRDRITRLEGRISALVQDGWLERCDDQVRLREQALLVSNEIFQEFLV